MVLTYDHVTDSDFEDDAQEQVVTQYYAYVDNGMPRGSNDSMANDHTVMQPMNPANLPRQEFLRQLSRNRMSWQ